MSRDLVQEFNDIITQIVSPRLKLLGYKKRNLSYNRLSESLIQNIRVQKSQWNHNERISFTFNYGCFNEFIFKLPRNDKAIPKFISDNDCFLWGRIGHLIYGKDYWYELLVDSNLDNLSNQVCDDLDNKLLPLMKNLRDLDFIQELVRRDVVQRPKGLIVNIDDIAIFELEFGDFERGKSILIDNYKRALIPKSVSSKTVYPDGREEIRWSEPSVNSHRIGELKRIANHYKIVFDAKESDN